MCILRCVIGAPIYLRTTRTIFFECCKMKKETKELVYLRSRPRKDGTQSLFLRASVNGVRKDEYLKLYVVPERTKADREKNRETLALAESIRAQRIVELQQMKFGIDAPIVKNVLFYDCLTASMRQHTDMQTRLTKAREMRRAERLAVSW